jgi:2-oxoisovalerate dehydrogenase E2 component (dihydrolipoyl transacylase)
MTTFNLPDLGEGLQEAEIVAWHVAEGEHVVTDQPLLSVETEKAVVEIPSPHSGRIARILAKPGERVAVGSPVLQFDEGPHSDSGTVVGNLPSSQPAITKSQSPAPHLPEADSRSTAIRASPAVRARAKTLGLNLTNITPTGPDHTITSADIEAASSRPASHVLRGAAKTMALNMARAWREVAHATLHDQANIENWTAQEDVTIRLIRSIVAACGAEPQLNATFDFQNMQLKPNRTIDLGLAIDSPDGLFVPVLRDIGRSASAAWRARIEAIKLGVKNRSLTPDDLRDPTFTLSNFGTLAGIHATLIIVPPQVAILGAGRITDRAIRTATLAAMHRSLPLSLTFDHRAVTGGQAARFLQAVVIDLERPN